MMKSNDILAMPGWSNYRIRPRKGDCVLSCSDRPAHEKLGLFREERQ
jgi:gentisate 1,2-dioxygenase